MTPIGIPIQDNLHSQRERLGEAIVLPGQTPQGVHILAVLLKRTYNILPGKPCVRAEKDYKLVSGDQHYDGPVNSSVKYESDFVPFKLATDVVLNGSAYAPVEQPVQELTASLQIGSNRKDVLVIGDRVAHYRQGADPVFSEPKPFTRMEIRYERAFGGIDVYSDRKVPCMYARNHLGRGYVILNSKKTVEQLELPNIEDPIDRLTPARLCIGHFIHWEKQPLPQGFGWVAKYWRPRALMAGVMPADRRFEQEMRAMYAQVVPLGQKAMYEQTQLPDMDFRFFNGASQGLTLPFMQGDEVITTTNLTPDGAMAFSLPGEHPRIGLDLGAGTQEPQVVVHTVMIRMEEKQVDLVWRAAVPYEGPDWLPQMKKMEISIQ